METQQEQVADWMRKFGQEVRSTPTIPPLEERKLRAKLILEEALETIKGLGFGVVSGMGSEFRLTLQSWHIDNSNERKPYPKTIEPSLVAIADGIADSLVVKVGTAVVCGHEITQVFDEVMRSNHSKLWTYEEITMERDGDGDVGPLCPDFDNKYDIKRVDECTMFTRSYLVKDKDGKVIKSPSYSPANITL